MTTGGERHSPGASGLEVLHDDSGNTLNKSAIKYTEHFHADNPTRRKRKKSRKGSDLY
jgi:hypothetical protein